MSSEAPKPPKKNVDELREATKLVVQATTGITDVVEEMHLRIASGPAILGRPLSIPAKLFVPIAYRNVRGITRLVGKAIEGVLGVLGPVLGESKPGPERDAVVAALNGVLGDWLAQTNSPLAIDMTLHRAADAGDGRRIVVFIHGSSMTHHQWRWNGHHHGVALARDTDWTPVYIQYNSGLSVLENGRLLAALLEAVADADDIAIVAHSMGGLVARAACAAAEAEPRAWRKKLRTFVTLGTPHQGAPLERGGSIIDMLLPISSYSAPLARLAKIRSVGITDLRRGLDIPLPAGVACFAIAGGRDQLVPVASAHGAIPEGSRSIVAGASHLDLLSSPEAYESIRRALAGSCR